MREEKSSLRGLRISPETAALVLVDWQERLEPAMEAERLAFSRRNAAILLQAAAETGMPVLATEQYPKGLGNTVAPLRKLLPMAPIAKTSFSCTESGRFMDALTALERRIVVLAGMETHVCVWQTARELRVRGYAVHVVADAVLSRTAENRAIGLGMMKAAGCYHTSAEVIAFDLVRGAKHPAFKAISKLVR